MSADKEDKGLDEAVRIALEAASAANDASSEIENIKSDSKLAADRTEAFRKRISTVVFGALGGAVIAIALGSLVYYRTISEMRKANATQIEALALFAESVDDLTASVEEVKSAGTTLMDASAEVVSVTTDLKMSVADTQASLSEELRAITSEATDMQPDVAAVVTDHLDTKMAENNNILIGAISELLATLELQQTPGDPSVMDAKTTALIEQIMLLQEQQKATMDLVKSSAAKAPAPRPATTTTRRASSTPKPAPNPFKFP